MGSVGLKRHVSRWWDLANDRRQKLVVEKHKGKGLTADQERELQMLQKVAEAVLEFYYEAPKLPDLQELSIKVMHRNTKGK